MDDYFYLPTENITELNTLSKFLQQQSLIDKDKTFASLLQREHANGQQNIYLGTGLCSSTTVTVGTPFDILSMVLMAMEIQKKVLPGVKIYHTIADVHASTNGFSCDAVSVAASNQKKLIQKVVALARMNESYQVNLASDYQNEVSFKSIHAAFALDKHPYVKEEVADVEYHYQVRKIGWKLGWAMSTRSPDSRDEVYFDNEYAFIKGPKIGFIYVSPGKTLDDLNLNKAPYTCMPEQLSTRVLLQHGEDASKKTSEAKCSDSTKKAYRNYLAQINRLFTKVTTAKLSGKTVEENTNEIIALILGQEHLEKTFFTKQ